MTLQRTNGVLVGVYAEGASIDMVDAVGQTLEAKVTDVELDGKQIEFVNLRVGTTTLSLSIRQAGEIAGALDAWRQSVDYNAVTGTEGYDNG